MLVSGLSDPGGADVIRAVGAEGSGTKGCPSSKTKSNWGKFWPLEKHFIELERQAGTRDSGSAGD